MAAAETGVILPGAANDRTTAPRAGFRGPMAVSSRAGAARRAARWRRSVHRRAAWRWSLRRRRSLSCRFCCRGVPDAASRRQPPSEPHRRRSGPTPASSCFADALPDPCYHPRSPRRRSLRQRPRRGRLPDPARRSADLPAARARSRRRLRPRRRAAVRPSGSILSSACRPSAGSRLVLAARAARRPEPAGFVMLLVLAT